MEPDEEVVLTRTQRVETVAVDHGTNLVTGPRPRTGPEVPAGQAAGGQAAGNVPSVGAGASIDLSFGLASVQ